MSDLAATNCGCSCNEGGCSSIIWIILLLGCCGNGSFFSGNGCGNGCGGCGDNLWIILLLLCCCGNGGGCGCF